MGDLRLGPARGQVSGENRGQVCFEFELEYTFASDAFLGICGPSGCGKTTLLRLLAGIERPDSGFIELDGQYWYRDEPRTWLRTQERGVGMVFQDGALFPHMSALQNVRYAGAGRQRAMHLLDRVGLGSKYDHRPSELSGGQKQRVALARALGRSPRLLLLDEPLSAVDEEARESLIELIKEVRTEAGIPGIIVSHSLVELQRLCGEILYLREGRLDASRYEFW